MAAGEWAISSDAAELGATPVTTPPAVLPPFDPSSRVGQGGFGSVYRIAEGRCIKVFHTPVGGDRHRHLLHLRAIETWARPSDRAVLCTRFARQSRFQPLNDAPSR